MGQGINERDGVSAGQRGGVIWTWRRSGRIDECWLTGKPFLSTCKDLVELEPREVLTSLRVDDRVEYEGPFLRHYRQAIAHSDSHQHHLSGVCGMHDR